MRKRRSTFLRTTKDDRSYIKNRHTEPGYFSRRQGWLALAMTPVLAIGVAMGGFVLPANAADGDPTTPSSTAATTSASTPTADTTPTDTTPTDTTSPGTPPADTAPTDAASPSSSPVPPASDTPAPASDTPAPPASQTKAPAPTVAPQQAPAAPKAQSLDVSPMSVATCLPSTGVACLKIVNTVVNTGGGTASDTDWNFSAQRQIRSGSTWGNSGAAFAFGAGDSKAVTAATGNNQRYRLSVSAGPANYTQTSANCDKGESVNSLQVSNNETVTCTYVYT